MRTLIGVALLTGLIRGQSKPDTPLSSSEAELTKYVESLGGRAVPDVSRRPVRVISVVFNKSVKDVDLAKLAGFSRLRMLGLADTTETDQALKQLDKLPGLEVLDLSRTTPGESFSMIEKLVNLREFFAEGAKLSEPMLATLTKLPKLEKVILAKAEIDDAGVAHLDKAKSLKRLNLNGTSTTLQSVSFQNLKALDTLHLAGSQTTDAGLKALAGLPSLYELDLSGTQVTDTGLKVLASLPKLERLLLTDTLVTGTGLSDLAVAKSIKNLTLGGASLTDAGLRRLTVLDHVQKLTLLKPSISDSALTSIAGMSGLSDLYIEGVPITDSGIRELAKRKTLKSAAFVKTKVTKAGAEALKAQLPGLTISFE